MHHRGGYAQAPKVERAKRQVDSMLKPRARSDSSLLSRWGAALIALRVPRGVGASAVALLLLASVSYGTIRGGHLPEISANVQDLCDAAANGLGFRITEVAIVGEHHLSRAQILDAAGITGRSSLLFLDAAKARIRLLQNPWIEQASLLKLYPGRLQIIIQERKPFALWQRDGRFALIAEDGAVLERDVPQNFTSLPLVVGKGAEHSASYLLKLIERFPLIASRLKDAVFVAERRWNLHLKNDLEVLLPESEPELALNVLADLDRTKKLLSRDILVIDLRFSDRVTVRQSDSAAQAREAEINAAEKNAKKKNRRDA
jgi:cell division protein FtsQ